MNTKITHWIATMALAMGVTASSYGQSVIVNEMSQGSAGAEEWVELLVVDDGVNMQGWELGDTDDGAWNSIVEFTTASEWASVAAGTLIVIYNGGDVDGTIPGADTDFSDNVVIIPHDNTTFFTDTGPWPGTGAFGNSDGDDTAAIRDASDTIIHDMAGAHPTANVPAPGSATAKYFLEDSVAEVGDDVNWSSGASTTGTPGAGNGGNNTTWIATLTGGSGGPTTNVRFSASSGSEAESVGTVQVVVYKSLTNGVVTGEIALGGTATEGAGNDYTVSPTNFTLTGAATSQVVTITVNDDGDIETPETIELTLANIVGGTPSAPTVYTLTITDNDAPPSQLIISEVADPADDFNGRFVELYNLGGSAIDLAADQWYLARQANAASFADIALTGTVAAGSTYVIAFSTNFPTLYPGAPAPDQFSGNINGNGNDGYFLYSGGDHFIGTLKDAYGVIDQDGSGEPWDYLDSQAERNDTVTQGNPTWTASEWTITPSANLADMSPGSYAGSGGAVTNIRFSVASATAGEGDVIYVVTVQKTAAGGDVTGQVALSGTALEGVGNDYTVDTTNFTLNGATTAANITITINDDGDQESAETVIMTLANVVGADVGTPSEFTLTINDNDAPAPAGGVVWINEIDYDGIGTPDSNEFFEIAGEAGTDLSVYSVVFYNGNGGAAYFTTNLTGVIDDEGCGFGAVEFYFSGNDRIQNGSPDGIALVSNGVSVLEFLSYEGSFNAVGGPADGLASTDIGVEDNNADEISVQLAGSGVAAVDFAWETNALSPGSLNLNQVIDPCTGGSNVPPVLAAIGNKSVQEGDPLVFGISATPTDGDTVTLSVSNAPAGSVFGSTNEVGTFTWLNPTPTGVYSVTFYAADDDGADSETITITVTPAPVVPSFNVWVNELHYENAGTDVDEGFEIAGEAGSSLADFYLYLYDGGGLFYDRVPLSGTLPDEGNGFGALWFTRAGIQNGPNDGFALVYESGATTSVIQFLSYEGGFFAIDGPVAFSSPTADLGVQESDSSGTNDTLQLCGTGTNYAEIVASGGWQGPEANTRGTLQPCLDFGGGGTTLDEYDITGVTVIPGLVSVGIDVTSNGVPYSLIYSTNILTDPQPDGTGVADSQNGTGGGITLEDTNPPDNFRLYWIKTN